MAERGETDATPLLSKFRHHSRRELDIRAPRWDEDRPFVEGLLRSHERSHAEDPKPAYARARSEARSRLPWWRRRSFNAKLDRLRRFVWLREEMRDLSSRMYWVIRRYVLEIARRRGLGDDVFFMTLSELLAGDRSHIEQARDTYESYRNFRAPPEVCYSNNAKSNVTERYDHNAKLFVTGIAVSRGTARGIARIARTIEEASRIEKGAILVCPFTDPGWTPILDRVAGVVTETGGLLSHAAVICREYGIPAVLAVPEATDRIRDGQIVIVDGDRGRVEIACTT
jgi:pyruvate,water dikinase